MSNRGYFRQLRILHLSLLAGLLLFTGIIFYLKYDKGALMPDDIQLERIFQGIAVVLSVGCLLIGYRRYNNALRKLRSSTAPVTEKIASYRVATIQWWALLDLPALFSLIGYFATGNFAFLALALFHITVLALSMPKKEVIVLLLNLNQAEVADLED